MFRYKNNLIDEKYKFIILKFGKENEGDVNN